MLKRIEAVLLIVIYMFAIGVAAWIFFVAVAAIFMLVGGAPG